MRVFFKRSCFVFFALIFNAQFTNLSYAATGIEWLSSIQNADGSYVASTDVATATQSTAETLSTFKVLLEQSQPGIPAALAFINAENYLNIENLARQIIANAELGNDVSVLVNDLITYQNFDGGFGEFSGYQSTALDTAFAIKALSMSSQNSSDAINYAVSYILSQQGVDGSFSLSAENESSVYITAVCASALRELLYKFNISSELDNALNYIIAAQTTSGWGSELETGLALNAIVSLVTDKSSYLPSVDWLRSQQLVNGSWSNDVYITALAERAIFLADSFTDPVSPTKGAITGRVMNQSTGVPIAGATISLSEDPFTTVQSDVNGIFNLIDLPATTYTLNYTALGFTGAGQTLTTQPGLLIDVGDVNLQPLPDVGIIKGTVTSSANGYPVSGALINVSGAFIGSTTSKVDGSYQIAGAPGTVVITISAATYEPATASGALNVSSAIIFSPALLAAGTTTTNPGVTLMGVLTDGTTNQVIQDATISVVSSTESTTSATDGSFAITGLQSGEIIISIVHADYLPQQFSLLTSDGAIINLGSIRLYQESPTVSSISGVVTDTISGAPVSDAEVRLVGTTNTATTNLNGEYVFTNLSDSAFTVTANATGYFSSTKNITVTQPTNVELNISLDRASSTGFYIADMYTKTNVYTYGAGDEVETVVVMRNTDVTDKSVRVFYKVINSIGEVIKEGPVVVVPLNADPSVSYVDAPAGQSIETGIDWYTLSSAPDDYQIIAQVFDTTTGQMLAERGMRITIQPTLQIGGSANFDPAITQLAANKSVKISAEMMNTGNQIIDSTSVIATLRLVNEGYKSRQDLISVKDTLTDDSFRETRGMDIDADGNLYVANRSGGTVSIVYPDKTTAIFADGLIAPMDVDIDANGNVYILQLNNSFVVIDKSGTRSEVVTGVKIQRGIETQVNGDAFITSGNALYNVTLAGVVTKIVSGGIANPRDLVVAADGTVYIASSGDNSISQYKDGQLSTFVEGINQPYGLAIDTNEDLIVTSYGDNSLLRVTPQGNISVITTGLSGPYDVILDPAGNFVVSNQMSNEIIQVDQNGIRTVIGEATTNQPYSAVYTASGELFVGNAGSSNITKYDSAGVASEFANGLTNPIELLPTSDGGLDVLESSGSIYHVLPDGSKTKIVDGRWTSTDFVKAPDGNGYITVESSRNLLARVDTAGQFSDYLGSMLNTVLVMTQSKAGNIYALGTSAGKPNYFLYKISPDYQVEVLAKNLGHSTGIAVDSNENVYLTLTYSRRILKIDSGGNVSIEAVAPFRPGAITVSENGDVLLAQYNGTTVYQLTAGGVLTAVVQTTTPIMFGLAKDVNGTIWTSNWTAGTVSRISNLNVTDTFTGITRSGSISLDTAGGVYVGSYQRIKHISDAGSITDVISTPKLTNINIRTFAIDANGHYLIPRPGSLLDLFDSGSNLVKRFTALIAPREMIDDGNGVLYLTTSNGVVKVRGNSTMAEVVVLGSFKTISKESADTAIVSAGMAPQRLNLNTGVLTSPMPYSQTAASSIQSIAVKQSGGFVMADYGANRLVFYDDNDVETDIQVGIVSPLGIMFDQSGKLLVVNELPRGLVSLRADKKAETHIPHASGFDYLQAKENGNFYATSRINGRIYEYNSALKLISTLAVAGSRSIAIASNDSLYVTVPSQGSLVSMATDGSKAYKKLAAGLSNAIDVETAKDGKVSISDKNSGSILTLNQNNTLSIGYSGITNVGYISYEPNGGLVVTSGNRSLKLLIENKPSVNFNFTSSLPLSATFSGIVVDNAGLIHVSTLNENSVIRMSVPGAVPEIGVGDIVFQSTANLNALQIEELSPTIDFGEWMPTISGDYQMEITATGGVIAKNNFNTIHVGAKAEGSFVLDETVLGAGDQPLVATLSLSGIDTTKFTKIDSSSVTLDAVTGARGRSVVADTLGNVYALDYNRIVKVTPAGAVSNFVSVISSGWWGQLLAIDSNNIIYFTDQSNTIKKVTPAGVVTTLASLNDFGSNPFVLSIAVSNDDRLYALINPNILIEIDTRTGAITTLSVNGLTEPKSLNIDAFGNLYVFNQNGLPGYPKIPTDTLIRISPEGVTTEIYDGAYFEYEGQAFTIDCSNNILFAPLAFRSNPGNYSEEDTIYQLIGETGEISEVFAGYASGLDGLTDMDVLYYDRFGQRLLIFSDYSWGKVYSFPVVCGGIDVDAHIVARNDVDLSSADPAPSSIIDNADGTKEYIWNLAEVNNQGANIQLNLLLASLKEGEVRDIFKRVYLEFNNSFNPDTPVKVDIDIPKVVVSSQLMINTVVDAAEYLPDTLVNISSDITNESKNIFNGALKTTIVDADGVVVASLTDVPITNIASKTSASYNSVWDTSSILAGDYTVQTTLLDANGLVIANSEQTFRITSGAEGVAFITSSVSSNKPLYSAWDQVDINGRVRNTSSNVIQGASVASITVIDSMGSIVHTESMPITMLTPGAYDDIALFFDLVDVAGGVYNVEMVSHDATSGAELTRSATSFTVERIVTQGIVGNINTAFPQLELGAANTCTETVTNISTSVVSNLTVKHLFVNAVTSEVLSTQSQTITLSGSESKSIDQTVMLANGEPGLYACVLQVETNGKAKTLATAGFEYIENPIDIDISLQPGMQGRVLVLLDSQTQYDEYGNAFQSDADPHGPIEASVLSVQRAYITQLLDNMGWAYTLVDTADSFTHELRSGGYSSYALFSEQIKLPNQVQEELREAVYRGEGLLAAGSHDMRNNKLVDALGIKINGKDASAEGFILQPSSVHSGGSSSFAFASTPLRISSLGAEVIGTYKGIDNTVFDEASNISVTRFTYGKGTSIFVGFDLLAQAAKGPLGNLSLFTELLVNVLNDVDLTGSAQSTGTVQTAELLLTNLGSATPGKVEINLPADSLLLDSKPGVQLTDNVIHWLFDLDVEEQVKLTFWLQLPQAAGDSNIDVQVFTGIEPNLELFDGAQLSLLSAPTTESLANIAVRIATLNIQDKSYKQATRLIKNAQSAYLAKDYSKALTAAVGAASELAGINATAAQLERLALAKIIRRIAQQQ